MTSATADHGVRRLAGRGAIYCLATALQFSAGFLVLPILTRLLPPGEYGQVATALIVMQLLAVVAAIGLPSAVTLDVFSGSGGPTRARSLVRATAVVGAAVVGVAFVLGPLWAKPLSGGFSPALQAGVLAAFPLAVLMSAQALLQAENQLRSFVSCAVLSTAGGQLFGLAMVHLGTVSAASYVTGLLVAYGAAAGLSVYLGGVHRARGRVALPALWGAIRLGGPTVPHTLALFVVAAGDRLVLDGLAGPGTVGRYQVAYVIGALGITGLAALNNAWAPLIYGSAESTRWQTLLRTAASVYELAAFGACSLALAAPVLLSVAAPSTYRPAGLVAASAIVALAALPYARYLSRVHVLFQLRKSGVLALASPLAGVLNVLLVLGLYPLFGVGGAAVATVGSYSLLAVLVGKRAQLLLPLRWEALRFRRLFALSSAGCLLAAVLPNSGLWLAIRILGAGVLAAVAVFRLRRTLMLEAR
jgi:O-antigen/teichoic acid export membrane protein